MMTQLMLRFFTITLFIFIFSCSSFAEKQWDQKELDQLYDKLQKYEELEHSDSTQLLAHQLFKLTKFDTNQIYRAKAAFILSDFYMNQSLKDSANYYYWKASETYLNLSDSVLAAEMILRIAYNQKLNGKTEAAIENYAKGIELISVESSPHWYGFANDNIGFLYFKRGDYLLALTSYQNAIRAFETLDNWSTVGAVYNKIGLVYRKVQDVVKEEEAYLKALKYLESLPANKFIAEVYNNYSELLIDKGELKKGFEILEKAKFIHLEIDYPIGMCAYYLVHAYHHSESDPVNYFKVIEYADLGIPIAEEYEDWRMYTDFCSYLGEAYFFTGQYDKAEKVLLKAIRIAKENQLKPEVQKLAQILSRLYETQKKSSQALYYLNLYVHLHDSLQGAEKLREFTELDLRFKFKQQQISDSIIQVQELQKIELEHSKELQTQHLLQLLYLMLSVLIIIIALFIYYYAHQNKRQALILQDKNRIIQDSLDDKEVLIKEIHHRVKNNLQLVSSLLELQSKSIEDETAKRVLGEGQERVRAMALIHQKLYQNRNLNTIDIKDYVALLVNEIATAYASNPKIEFQMNVDQLYFDIDTAIPLGLILNELITNAVKYAFEDTKNAQVDIVIHKKDENFHRLLVRDNGIGISKDLDIDHLESLGIKLVKRLSKQLHGVLRIRNKNGSEFEILFKDVVQREKED